MCWSWRRTAHCTMSKGRQRILSTMSPLDGRPPLMAFSTPVLAVRYEPALLNVAVSTDSWLRPPATRTNFGTARTIVVADLSWLAFQTIAHTTGTPTYRHIQAPACS